MASPARNLLLQPARSPWRSSCRRIRSRQAVQWQRSLSLTPCRYEDEKPAAESTSLSKVSSTSKNARRRVRSWDKETPQERTAARLAQLSADLAALNPDLIAEAVRTGKRGQPWRDNRDMKHEDFLPQQQEKFKVGFWAEGQEELGPDEDFYGDDITSHGHGELEQHRELREYARLIAWELPLLNQLAKPFELPTAATPFRFRYTSYLGEEHPAANKVVVEFAASDMPDLTLVQKNKLIKLAGPRYNPSTDIVKMSCELFDTLPQNKRFLGDTISKLLAEARDGADTFEDVPFDFRHHKPKVRHQFPKEWILTDERKKYLEGKRQQSLELDQQKLVAGHIVDGERIVGNSLPFMVAEEEPVLVAAGQGKQRQLR
ncbi:hypothetical protein K491DRAFT_625670 [Lophiostoma macrostomum CBS 122681]|uniref:Small ribosomal subunit protein mS35 mitochondrial conserved domain-containing protein n=1 Tax=Lophiostoma macrostomum CBS 122681 TaxID=1314788 RepID=A0A6A6TCX7_9PLEO|nr:hypothetical protein K491DRAFT_625670 [Lophiostoma macrostomum CBS 122681]